jgi:hypothetical protein
MSALSPLPAPPTPLDPTAVRLVLFGMPDAGKSSLLGALAQAAHTQSRALHAHLNDLSHGLEELRNRVYEDRPRETQEEIVPYAVKFSPYGQAGWPAILYDCDGRAANDLLTQKRSLEQEARVGPLASAVLAADALILTIDASAPHNQIDDDFREFLRFLKFLESYRSREHAVGGLPVFLVLTKCDLLARDSASRSVWEARIAERQQEVMKRFKQFLADEHGTQVGLLSFGSVDLEVRATAVRQPGLTDAPARPREPFGVAELFHAAFADAMNFRQRRARAQKRLIWTVAGAGTFLAAMALAATVFLFAPPNATAPTLADRVESIKASEGASAATRLGPGLDRRLRDWLDVQANSAFPQLSEQLQTLVRTRIEEGQAYVHFRDDLAAIPLPTRTRSLSELAQIESRLNKLSPPALYLGDWGPTDAMRQRDLLLKTEIPALREAVEKLKQHYFSLKGRATVLLQTTELNSEWEQQLRTAETAAAAQPFPRSDPALGVAYEFDDVTLAAADWQHTWDRVTSLRDLATALGLVGPGDIAKAPLALTAPPADASVPELASRRWQSLKANYPTYTKWSLAAFPDAVRPELERRVRRSIEQSSRDGQRLILERVKLLNTSGTEVAADWPKVGDFLMSPPLQDWRELTSYLARLAEPTAEEPVQATAAFLKRASFELEIKRVRVRIPDTLSDAPVRPSGDLLIAHRRPGSEATLLSLRPEGEPQRDKQSLAYTFAATGNGIITYHPGETFFAELPTRKGDRDLKLTWASSRTMSYQFERLMREPRLHAPDQSNVEGLLADGVTVNVVDGKLPAVPPMVPIVWLEKK